MTAPADLDIEQPEALLAYLRAQGHLGAEAPEMRVLAGGVSNRTVWVGFPDGREWVLKQALEKLRTQADWFSDVARIHREAAGMRWLNALAPQAVPQLVFEDLQRHILAMKAVPQPHHNWKALLLSGGFKADHVGQFARLLGAFHRHSFLHPDEGRALFADRSFFESLRLEPYFAYAAERNPAVAPFLHALIEENRHHLLAVVHGDYSPKNVLIQAGRVVLLDYEVIHWGDPTFDLGFSLTHLLSKAHHLPALRGLLLGAVGLYWQTYAAAAPELVALEGYQARAVRQTLGCLLARVDGRSPLEYLNGAERDRQRRAVLELMRDPPPTVEALAASFARRIKL